MLYARLLYFASVAAAFVFYYFYAGILSWYFLLFVLLLPLASLFLCKLGANDVALQITGDTVTTQGFSAQCTLRFYKKIGKRNLPVMGKILCRVKIENAYTNESIQTREKTIGGFVSEIKISLPTYHCGVVACTVNNVGFCDPLGLFILRKKLQGTFSLAVLPVDQKPEELPDLHSLDPKGSVLVPKIGGGFAEEYEVRPYRSGDPIRSIHWKLSGKTDDPVVREQMVPPYIFVTVCPVSCHSIEEGDLLAANLQYLGQKLLDMGRPFLLRLESGGRNVTTEQDLQAGLISLLSSPYPTDLPAPRPDKESVVLAVSPFGAKEVGDDD